MKQSYSKSIRKRKRRIERRLRRVGWTEQSEPMMGGGNIGYEIADRDRGMNYGGIGVVVELVRAVGLREAIDEGVQVLKRHLPYHESDHVLNLAYNVMLGGERLEDIERLRQDEVYLDALSASRIPDPTTAGDFTRRLDAQAIEQLQESVNRVRKLIWEMSGGLGEAVLDVDGTISGTEGECKEGMDNSYKGIWGYAPLLVSLWNTKEPLYLVNRPGNAPSQQGAVKWVDLAIELVRPHSEGIWLRGDTAFGETANLDRWHEQEVRFVFGWDVHAGMVKRLEALPKAAWRALPRARHAVKTKERRKPENVKERIVREREYQNLRLISEQVAEIEYQPTGCRRSYRVIAVKKNLSVEKGEAVLFDDVRYFLYLTNSRTLTAEEVVEFAHQRCDQENVIEQLKNGVNALRMPVDNLNSNWAYMVMASLAWTLKAWLALFMRQNRAPQDKAQAEEVLTMEFRRFLNAFMLLPCQIVRTGRRVLYRLQGYNRWLGAFLRTFQRIHQIRLRGGLAALV